jgi:hypothetical protein
MHLWNDDRHSIKNMAVHPTRFWASCSANCFQKRKLFLRPGTACNEFHGRRLYGLKFYNFTRPCPRTIWPDPAWVRNVPSNTLPVPDRRSNSFYSSPNEARSTYNLP